jgi:protocatechuate 3,4-dioxygenase beta subunit
MAILFPLPRSKPPRIDAVLSPGCIISGTVTDTSANPIQFVEVYACDIAGNFIFGGDTDGSGNYEINGLTPGSFKVFFYTYYLNHYGVEWYGLPRNYNYKYEWYNDKENFADADMVAVTLQSPATGIDAVLAEDGGIITGQITDGQGSGIEGCIVYAFYSRENFLDYENSNYSDSDGYYQVKGLPAGNYIIMFSPPGGTSYRRILYDNCLDYDNANEVPVLAGQTTSGIDAVLPKGGWISGRVTDGNGNGLNDVTLRLINAATNKYQGAIGHGATTDVDGYYTINAQVGQWKLLFMGYSVSGGVEYVSEFYNDQSSADNADTLTVNVDETLSDIDAVLSPGGGKISGYVKDAAETGLYGVTVEVWGGQYDYWIGNTQTDTNGYFEIPGLMAGSYKILTRTNDIYPVEWYSDKTSYETADLVTVTEGGNTEVTIILGGADPNPAGISGQVTDYSGSGIENVTVNIYDPGNNFIDSALTDINGDYAVQGIPSGDYKVYFDTGTAGNYLPEWYENKGAFDEADTITVSPGQALTGIDAQLEQGGTLSGRVMNEAEVGVEGVLVRVRDLDRNLITTANTDANGDYTIDRLPANSYKIHFDVKNANGYYVSQWYNNRDSFDTANIVIVMGGGTTTVDAILGDGIGISGTVTDGTNPLESIGVEIYDTGGLYIAYGYTDSSGNYEVKGLAPGNYKVHFDPSDLNYHGVDWFGLPANTNYKYQWYNNHESFVDADVVTAAPGSAAAGIDAVMTDGQGGIISGQITDSQANGIEGCLVYAFESEEAVEWYYSDPVRTGVDGNYQIKGLPTGDYIVFFMPPGGTYYRRQFYNNTMDIDQAALVSVTAGQTTPGINAVLQKGGIVTGRVTDSSGNGLEDVIIRLMDAATNKYMGWMGNSGRTDADGYYTVNAQPGQWKVMFQTFAMSGGEYVSEFYNNQLTVENGHIITVAVEEEVANINAILSLGGGKISGFVKDPGNTGLYNVTVYLYDTQYKTFVGHTETDLNGYFEIPGLIPGSYKLYAMYNRIYPAEWYSDGADYATADELAVTAGGNTQVLVILGAPDTVLPSIQVTSPNGGESLTGGTTHEITWTSQENIEAVLIEYSIDNGDSWITIEPFAENTGIYQWTVPETPSENCLVRIGASDSDAGPVDTSDAVFSIVTTGPASIKLKSPNRWVSITAGTTEEITWYWTGGGAADNIILEYSIDSGQTWLMIVPGMDNTGSYFWYVPNTPSEHCLIRIQVGEGDEVLSDISEVEFSIITPSTPVLHLFTPNGGETWKVGHFYNITWDTIGTIENVKLEYSINGGGSWIEIIASTLNTGSFEWTVPDSPAESCLVRVSDVLGGSTDTSNESFAIVPASTATLDVTSPNGGENLTVGATHDITWTSSEMENVEIVMIEYSVDNGVTWTTVDPAAAHNGTGGSYNWTVPDTPSETCLVRITDLSSDEGPSDVSDAVFTIEPAPFITVNSPNGGEQWQTGTTYAINWTYSGITGNVVIDLYRGTSFDSNITNAAVDTGSFDWNIPINFTNADDYKVLIYQDTIEDYSNNYFAINDQAPNNPDFNNDGSVDILWRNYAAGGNEVWLMNGAVRTSTVNLQAEAGLDWRIVGTGDFNRDGKVDLLWRNYTNGQNMVWYMNGTALTGTAALPVQPDVNYQVAGAGDFNGDGSMDILWRHVVEGRNQVWYMNGVTVTGYMGLVELKDTTWRIAGLGDFNDDDKVDILWRNYVTGYNQVWYMDGVTRIGIVDLMENTDLTWQIAGTGDFNQDGNIDILWRRYSDGMNMIWYMDGIVRLGFEYIESRSDLTWRIVGNGDYKE